MKPPTRTHPSATRSFAAALVALCALLLAGCATVNPHFDSAKPHHHPEGFRNLHTDFQPKGLLTVLQWQWDAVRNGLPRPPATPTPTIAPDLSFIHANARQGAAMGPALTWIGHATMLAQMGGLNWLTDPVFSERASPVASFGPRRAQPPGLSLAQLPRIDVVLVSHNHYDHLDETSVKTLNAQAGGPPLFVVPLGLKTWFADIGIQRVMELDWWDSLRLDAPGGAVDVVLTPAQHWSGRTLADRLATLWGGFAVFAPDLHLVYTGDTGYSPDFKEIRRRFAARQTDAGFDVALIPVGAYEPRWFMATQHVNPAEAVQIHLDLGATRSVGVHWGTFNLTDESLDEPPKALAEARRAAGLADETFQVLAIGQTLKLPRRALSAAGL
jgi:N-acyl-phosphatidylethanolamine-hydrolysing phospholipase D